MTESIGRVAAEAMHEGYEKIGDPGQNFVAMMAAAAMSGHMIDRTPEQMHKALDDVMAVAQAMVLEMTQTKQ